MTQTIMSSVHNLNYEGKLPASIQFRHCISTTLLFSNTYKNKILLHCTCALASFGVNKSWSTSLQSEPIKKKSACGHVKFQLF